MNISFNWLKKYINLGLTPDETSAKLTSLGLEVGTLETVQTIKGGLEGLVVAEVLTCEKHENSDHLNVTTVNNGSGEPIQVVCGASNCRASLKTIMATVGTKLYSDEGDFTIKKSKIRGVESFGMLCAEDEIGLGTAHAGIIELPADAVVGTLAKDYYKVENDTVLEVDITPNRADAISHFGVARDLAASLNLELNKPSVDSFKIDNESLNIEVNIENTESCPRYSGLTISGVEVKESPEWLKNSLSAIGLRPINNIVDITNFILHELGQPLHAFDADKIKGGKIVVKNLPTGTKFTTLDGAERELNENDLMICNADEPMALAGVFGGLESGITESTKNIFIESAYFNPITTRKTARRHVLNTDASFRYERGCDPNITIYALKRAALLVQEVAGGEVSSNIVDIYPNPIENFKVELAYSKVNSLIGKIIEKDTIKTILKGLEIIIEKEENEVLSLSVPPYRTDVQRDVDVIEDILRVYGYNNILIDDNLNSSINYSNKPDSTSLQNKISDNLTGAGFNEILNNSLTKVAYYENSKSFPIDRAVKIMNPLSNDLGVMRQTLLFGGLESIAHNQNHRLGSCKFYELGACYHYNADKKSEDNVLSAYSEEQHLGLWLSGSTNEQIWTDSERKLSFYDLKAYVINILSKLGISSEAYTTKEYSADIYKQAISFETRGGKILATLGIVSTSILKSFGIENEVYYADIEWKQVLKQLKKAKTTYKDFSKYPEVKRDLALLLDKEVKFEQLETIAYQVEKKLLKKVVLFDVYEGKNLEAGKKSYAINFTLQDNEKTLNDKQIDKIMQNLIKAYQEKLNAKIR